MEYSRVVRQALPSSVQFCQCTIIIEISCVEIFSPRKVRFACIWTEARGCLNSRLCQGNALGGTIVTTKVNAIMHLGELTIGLEKGWIARRSLIQQVNRLEQVIPSYVISE